MQVLRGCPCHLQVREPQILEIQHIYEGTALHISSVVALKQKYTVSDSYCRAQQKNTNLKLAFQVEKGGYREPCIAVNARFCKGTRTPSNLPCFTIAFVLYVWSVCVCAGSVPVRVGKDRTPLPFSCVRFEGIISLL